MTEPDLTVESVRLLSFTPPLKLRACCATPQNNVHSATLDDVKQWAAEHGYELTPTNRETFHHPV